MATERITIEGQGLTVTHDQADPKRRRPERFASSVVSADYRTVQQVAEQGNPFWSGEANDAADQSDLPPIELARQWAAHRKPDYASERDGRPIDTVE